MILLTILYIIYKTLKILIFVDFCRQKNFFVDKNFCRQIFIFVDNCHCRQLSLQALVQKAILPVEGHFENALLAKFACELLFTESVSTGTNSHRISQFFKNTMAGVEHEHKNGSM